MGESACLVHSFTYASGIPNETNQGQLQENPMHALGDSVSFGRFMSESLAWEKWSAFSQKRHVEDAERYSKPGSVAQKKAFFEAHYKKIAAKKAAVLLEQANAAPNTPESEFEGNYHSQAMRVNSQVAADEQEEVKTQNNKDFIDNADDHNVNEKPIEFDIGKVGGADSVEIPISTIDSIVKSGSNPKSLSIFAPTSDKTSKDSATSLRSPCSENIRDNMSIDPSASGSKKTGPKWRLLSSAFFRSLSTPFSSRTKERAVRREQKHEEKSSGKEGQKVQTKEKIQEKPRTEVRKLRLSLCFRAHPLPDSCKENKTSKNLKNKQTPQGHPKSPTCPNATQDMNPFSVSSSTKRNAFSNVLKENS